MSNKYFDFSRLQEYFDMFAAGVIFIAVIFVVYVLASLYYATTRDLRKK